MIHPMHLSGIAPQCRLSTTSNLYADCQALLDRQLFDQVLKHTGGNLTQAAKILGITRATLRSKVTAIGLPVEKDTQANSAT